MLDLKFMLEPGGIAPMRATDGSAAFDLFVPESERRVGVYPGHVTSLDLRIRLAIPAGHAGIMLPRSGIGSKKALALANTFGLIDSDYRGTIQAKLILGPAGSEKMPNDPIVLRAWEPILQLFIVPIPALRLFEVARLDGTERGEGGFGSTTQQTQQTQEKARDSGRPAVPALNELFPGKGDGKAGS